MNRKFGGLVAGVALVVLLAGCADDGAGKSGAADGKSVSISGQPEGLPAAASITNDGSNSCAGQGLHANVTTSFKRPFVDDTFAERRQVNGGVVDESALQMRVDGTTVTWQVADKGSYVCDAYVKYGDSWRHMDPKPVTMLETNGVSEVYATAYDPALGDFTDRGLSDTE